MMSLIRWARQGALTAVGLAATASALCAQQGTVAGRVTDESTGRPVASARVQLTRGTTSALTNADGQFAITLPAGQHELRVQLVGYASVVQRLSVRAGETTTADFALKRAVISMEEVVVTGTAGAARRREIGNTITQISIQQVETAPVQTVADVLQGRAAGLTVIENSGQVGSAQTIRLRGIKSVTQGNTPLLYIDGVRMSNRTYETVGEAGQTSSPLSDINPQDIDRVEVIKGAAATTLYGTEASSGVIQIFTKRGSQGRPVWSLQVESGQHRMGHVGPAADSTGLNMNDCRHEPGCPFFSDKNLDGVPDSSQKGWFRSALLQRYLASVRGAVGTVSYFLSGNFGHEQGVVDPTFLRRWGVRGNFGFAPSDALNINFNNSFSQQRSRWFPDGNNLEGLSLNVMRGPAGYPPGNDDSVIMDMIVWLTTYHFTSGLSFNFAPKPNFTHRLNLGLDFAQSDSETDHPYGFWNLPLGRRADEQQEERNATIDYAGTWEMNVASGLTSAFSWGGQLYNENRYGLDGVGNDFPAPGIKLVDNAARTDAFEARSNVTNGGFFIQEVIGISDRLFLTGGLRVDGHSSFGEDFGLAPYPKFSVAYTLSDHPFWPDWFEQMKIRAAYGESGKAPGIFDAVRTWEPVAGDEARPAVTPDNLGNPELGPERTREIEVGFEGTAFDSRVAAELTYYQQKTYDALVDVQQTPSNGFPGTQLTNVGEVRNRGVETQLNLSVLRGTSLNWDLGVRYSHNKSEAVNLGDVDTIGSGSQRIVVGLPVPTYFKDSIINGSEIGVAPVFEEMAVGPTYPVNQWGLNTTVSFGPLTFDALGEAHLGHWLSSGVALQNARRGVWPVCAHVEAAHRAIVDSGDSTAWNGLTAYDRGRCDHFGVTIPARAWISPADFFKLRQVGLSYALPARILPAGVRSAHLRIQGRNLWKTTRFVGLDPEAIDNGSYDNLNREEYYSIPAPRTFLASLKIEF
jgi:TonB-linked SusC/RagA family outer membrane protein